MEHTFTARRAVVPAAFALVLAGCAGAVALAPGEASRLAAGPEIPTAFLASAGPTVDCPTDEGVRVWTYSGSSLETPPGLPELGAADGPAPAVIPVLMGGDIWSDFEENWTQQLRQAYPVDPAQATAAEFADAAHAAARPFPVAAEPVKIADAGRGTLSSRFGGSPVLVFETSRWSLVGCWYDYVPWFDVRASLVDPASGRVLWRDTCSTLYPPDSIAAASREKLREDGQALYARQTRDRSRSCAASLLRKFSAGAPAR